MDRTTAFRAIHAPETFDEKNEARQRLALDELLRLQLEIVMRRQASERDARGISHTVATASADDDLVGAFLAQLPFSPTAAQTRAMAEIMKDLAGPLPMHRLLQGDVGSGKTVVAVATLLVAVQGGHQGAFMAPTEVLAEQHFFGVRELLAGLVVPDTGTLAGSRPLNVALLTSRTPAGARAKLHEGLRRRCRRRGGGHARPADRRRALRQSGGGGHRRTAPVRGGAARRPAGQGPGRGQRRGGRSRPPGHDGHAHSPDGGHGGLRRSRRDRARRAAGRPGAHPDGVGPDRGRRGRRPGNGSGDEVAAGHRAYVVCPLVEGSENIQAKSATQEKQRLEQTVLAGLPIGLLHGQLKAADKEGVMAAFRRGELSVLVATTVVEVGVDVAEATVMVIEDADRFGIAQLHQLRGRVGRSDLASWCYLLSAGSTPDAVTRLEALEKTTDGFELAEVDLDLRGEGTILGSRQKGRSDLKLASLRRGDRALVAAARQIAESLLGEDAALESTDGVGRRAPPVRG